MTFKPFKISLFLLLLSGVTFAQKFDKKFNEKFYTNSDVVVDINASNAEIDVTTWDKDEVSVEAIIEVEGLDKKEAEEYFKNWKFEALGNKAKVQINANRSGFRSFGKDNFVIFNQSNDNFPGAYRIGPNEDSFIVLPEIKDIDIPEIEIPEIDFDELALPEIEEFSFDKYSKDGDVYFFNWKDGVNDITIKSKEEWEKFKKTKEYKKFKKAEEKRKKELKARAEELKKQRFEHRKEMQRAREERTKELKRVREEQREALAKARVELKRINKKEIQEALAKAQKQLKNTKFSYSFSSDDDDFMMNDKKVKVTKKILIKVPKNATFDLNTRHCKVKLPKGKVNGKVSYGNFKADAIQGGELNVSFSPVTIESLNACTLFLNNVTDAKLVSVTNTKLDTNSSEVTINNINKNVEVTNRFGELNILQVSPTFNKLKVLLNSSSATVNLSKVKDELVYSIEEKNSFYPNNSAMKFSTKEATKKINGNFTLSTLNKNLVINGKYAQLTVHE